jgi:TonB-dependent starch-binding outer membrane protein SusC
MSMTYRTMLTLLGAGAMCVSSGCARSGRAERPSADSVEIGYGAQPREKVTGAVTSISEPDAARPLRVEELLRGKVSGVQVLVRGDRVTLRIRGDRALIPDQEREPLVIVDGVMIQEGNIANALAGLTPDDIRKVDVLKDVASTSIYGSRGAGGVILITTKRKEE